MASRLFTSKRRLRQLTDVDFVQSAMSDARLCYHLAEGALAYDPAFGDGDDATEMQSIADGVDTDDIAEALRARDDARARVRNLTASAPLFAHLFAPDADNILLAAAHDLDLAANELTARIEDFARFAIDVEAHDAPVEEDLTDAQEALLADPPVLLVAPRAAGEPGAPRFVVSEEDLERLWVMFADWRWTQARIAGVLGCSPRTVRTIFAESGVARPAPDLERIRATIEEHMRAGASGVGIRKICGALTAAGVPFTWRAVGAALAELDPAGRDQRYRHRVPRVHYNVRNANGMWHVDGYEHLVQYNIYIEGIIDGGSRKVLALHAVDNKFATTMGSFVIDAVINFGVPHKLRTDCGTENVDMERYATLLRSAGYKIKYLKGPSFVTRNQRIERYWGDLCPYIAPILAALQSLERRGVLRLWLDEHHTALHLVLLPYVNRVCESARNAWNHHYMGTADMKTSPERKFDVSAAAQRRQGRWQELVVDANGFVLEAPARLAALAARGIAAVPFVPSEELEWIDDFAASVTRDADRVCTGRTPVSAPVPWYTSEMRDAIAAAVTPLMPGEGELHAELERRFLRALTYLHALDARVQLGFAVGLADVAALAVTVL